MAYFSENYDNIIFTKEGLRNAQLGAVHSIASYFTLHQAEPAIVVMPTGSGKTAVICLSPYLLCSQRVLVISSSVLVRGQIIEEFNELKTLKKVGAFGQDITLPSVKEVTSVVNTDIHWESFRDFDVVVGVPNSLSGGFESGIVPPLDLFDLIIVDEAHHSPAKTWKSVVEKFPESKKIYFTATPFRRDKKEIKGNLVYSYPLAKAHEDGIFGDIGYIAIPNTEDDAEKHISIAQKAEEVFQTDKSNGFQHAILVRAGSKKQADELDVIYAEHTSLNLKVVHSNHTFSHIKTIINKLRSSEIDGVICVDMMGEGFDFPNLKIGAIHAEHKSLAVTLQFIGRFARTNAENIGQAKFIAMESDITIGKEALYKEGAIWMNILFDLSTGALNEVREEKEFFQAFESDGLDEFDFSDLSLSTLYPFFHVKIYRVSEIELSNFTSIAGVEVVFSRFSEEHNTLVFIVKRNTPPKWIKSQLVQNVDFLLTVLYFDSNRNLLFIHSSGEKGNSYYEELLSDFGVTNFELIPKKDIHKVLSGFRNPSFYNIGLQNRAVTSGESYKIIAGSSAQNSVRQSDGRLYSSGHLQCAGDTDSGRDTVGYSSGSKVWSNRYLPLRAFKDYCDVLGTKILSDIQVVTNTSIDNIPIAVSINQLPDNISVYSIDWHEKSYKNQPSITVKQNGERLLRDALLEADLAVDFEYINQTEVRFYLNFSTCSIYLSYSFMEKYKILSEEDFEITIRDTDGNIHDVLSYLNDFPLVYSLTDCSTIREHNELLKGSNQNAFNNERLETVDWQQLDTDISKEFGNPIEVGKKSIHQAIEEMILQKDFDCVFYDHDTGEIGDFIAIKEIGREIHVEIYHAKAAKAQQTGDRVEYLYEVCGQAQKSVIWTSGRQIFFNKLLQRIDGRTERFRKGNLEVLNRLKESGKVLKFEIFAIQPGISKSRLSLKLSHLLAATDDYISTNGNNERFRVLCSE